MTPEQLAKAGTEHAHQVALMCWCALHFKTWPKLARIFAVPNGGERNPIVAGRLKAEGVKSGVPDLFLPVARHGYHGFFIEMKKPDGVIGKNQPAWEVFLKEEGFAHMYAYGWEQAASALQWYMTE